MFNQAGITNDPLRNINHLCLVERRGIKAFAISKIEMTEIKEGQLLPTEIILSEEAIQKLTDSLHRAGWRPSVVYQNDALQDNRNFVKYLQGTVDKLIK